MERAHITDIEWPSTTKELLASLEAINAREGEDAVNQSILSLVRARKALNDARLACLFARRFHPAHERVKQRLESIAAALKLEHDRFPLTVLEGGKSWKRPTIFPQP